MKSVMSALLLSGAIGILVTGCASSTPTFRGQSPASFASHSGGHGDNCPMCQMNGQPHGGLHHGGAYHGGQEMNLPFHPVHRNFHTYSVPENLMYPPENQGAAVYQYPYYTLRGPTDFFMK